MRHVTVPFNFLEHFFVTQSKHRFLGTQFVHGGDGDGDVTNLNLPIISNLIQFVPRLVPIHYFAAQPEGEVGKL